MAAGGAMERQMFSVLGIALPSQPPRGGKLFEKRKIKVSF
jgi:hypothetical protein